MNHRLYSLLALLGCIAMTSQAQDDSKVNYSDRQFLGNVAYGSASPVSLKYMPITDLADIHVGYRHAGGDFHLIDQSGSLDSWTASFTGMKRVGKVSFGGGLVYENTTLDDRRWNNTLFVSPYNPYIIGDSLRSKFNTETFHLNGGAAYSPDDRLTIALEATYDVGSSATQKDPRPEIKGMRFNLSPGIEYRLGRHSIGASADIEWLSEEVSHTVLRTTTKQYVFLFQGLGVYETKDAVGYARKYDGSRYGVQIQYSLNNNADARLADFFQIGYYSEHEDAEDGGSSVKYKGGRYKGCGFSMFNRLMFRATERTIHNLTISAAMSDITGRWYTQRAGTDSNGNLIYEVVNESDNLEGSIMQAGIAYRFDRLGRFGIPLFQAEVTASLDNSETKNRIYAAKEKYSNAIVSASVTKRFKVSRGWLAASVGGAYRMSLDKKLNIDGMPDTYSQIMSKYTRPQFEAVTSGYWRAGGGVTYSLPMTFMGYDSIFEVALDGDYTSRTDKALTVGDDRSHVVARVGFVF